MIARLSQWWRDRFKRPAQSHVTLARLQRDAERGDGEARYRLAQTYLADRQSGEAAHKAVNWLELAARSGHSKAQYRLSLIYLNGFAASGPTAVWQAEACSAAAQDNLRLLYPDGAAIAPQPERAFALAEASAMQGHAAAQAHLGMLLLRGVGCVQDFAAATIWFRRADDQQADDVIGGGGALGLGLILEHGLGCAADPARAALYYERATKAGNDAAATALALMHLNGRVEADLAQAERLLIGPAARGNAFAQHGLQRLRETLAEANPVALQPDYQKDSSHGSQRPPPVLSRRIQ